VQVGPDTEECLDLPQALFRMAQHKIAAFGGLFFGFSADRRC
jgi:hypothetical protein